jgi:hypothetical protein
MRLGHRTLSQNVQLSIEMVPEIPSHEGLFANKQTMVGFCLDSAPSVSHSLGVQHPTAFVISGAIAAITTTVPSEDSSGKGKGAKTGDRAGHNITAIGVSSNYFDVRIEVATFHERISTAATGDGEGKCRQLITSLSRCKQHACDQDIGESSPREKAA